MHPWIETWGPLPLNNAWEEEEPVKYCEKELNDKSEMFLRYPTELKVATEFNR